jgi:molecular chaperone GrpE
MTTPEHSDAVDTEAVTPGAGHSGDAPASAATTRTAADPRTPPDQPPADSAAPEGAASPAEEAQDPAEDAQEPDAPEEAHRQLEQDIEELAAKAEKADAYLELAQRTKADFENYRKRASREAAAAQERGIAKLAKELLPAVDNLDRALAAALGENGADTLVSGIKLVHADVIAALARAGIEPFSPQGEQFDPQHHEAIAQQPVEGAQPGTVVEVYQRGYRLGESVLRPARVVVAG